MFLNVKIYTKYLDRTKIWRNTQKSKNTETKNNLKIIISGVQIFYREKNKQIIWCESINFVYCFIQLTTFFFENMFLSFFFSFLYMYDYIFNKCFYHEYVKTFYTHFMFILLFFILWKSFDFFLYVDFKWIHNFHIQQNK